MCLEARVGAAAVRYTSVGTEFRGRKIHGQGPKIHGRKGGSGYADRPARFLPLTCDFMTPAHPRRHPRQLDRAGSRSAKAVVDPAVGRDRLSVDSVSLYLGKTATPCRLRTITVHRGARQRGPAKIRYSRAGTYSCRSVQPRESRSVTPAGWPVNSQPAGDGVSRGRALRGCGRVPPGQPEQGKGEGNEAKKDPAGVEAGTGHEVPENDRDEETADGGEREHQAGCRADVLVVDVADPGRYRQPGGETE